jgi:intergrase/recombinase
MEELLNYHIDKVDRLNKIRKAIHLYIYFCHENEFITDEEFLYLFSYFQVGAGDTAILYVIEDSDLETRVPNTKVTVIDLRPLVERLKSYRTQFDWALIKDYI